MIRMLLPFAVLGMGCTPVPADNGQAVQTPTEAAPTPEPKQNASLPMVCDAAKAQDIVGKAYVESIGKDAVAHTGSRSLRVIKPGMAVTMDYRNDRLNIEVDEAGKITTVRCG